MSQLRTLTPQQVQSMIHDGGELALLDVREAGQFGESHLLFATPLPYSRLESGAVELVPRPQTRIVLCDDGDSGIAGLAARRLQAIGYSNVALLAGGTRGWAAAGYTLFAGVNVPSKLFGELVEHEYHTPRVTVAELARMREANEDVVVVDGRPYGEYQKMNIPGGICCPNAELPYRIREIVKSPQTKIVVNCAGRTRSILGAQTLINFGVDNPVYALENGTQGWVLADFKLERGATRRYPEDVSASELPALRARAEELMARHAARTVSAAEVQKWFSEETRTTYLIDVRTPEEYAAGSLPGAIHAPGGQLIQATDQWVGVRNARIVLFDGEGVRAPVVASWLVQLGCEAYVLAGGTRAEVVAPPRREPLLPRVAEAAPADVKRMKDKDALILDLRESMSFRKRHIPGSRWSIRPRIKNDIGDHTGTVMLVSDDASIARCAAVDLAEAGLHDIVRLQGGLAAWAGAGYAVEESPQVPPDSDCIDYLFFVHDRHAGNREAMRQYLAWETGLIAQLSAEDRRLFRVGSAGESARAG